MRNLGRTRVALAAMPIAALALPLTAHAATSGDSFRDASGDIAIPSLDIVAGAVRLDSSGSQRTLTMSATMRGDLVGPPADYDLVTGARRGNTCYALAARVRWNGATLAQSYQHVSTVDCTADITPSYLAAFGAEVARYAVGGDPADASASGRTVTVTLSAPSWLTPGTRATYGVLSHTTAIAHSSSVGYAEASNYDMAGSGRQWRVS